MYTILQLSFLVLVVIVSILFSDIRGLPPSPCCQTNSTCIGVGHENHFDIICHTESVIAIYNITVGTKRNSTGCPEFWYTSNDSSCCEISTDDCTFLYDSNLDQQYHNGSNGNDMKTQLRAGRSATSSVCKERSDYYGYTNYMYVDYNCIERTLIFDMFSYIEESVEAEALYIWSDTYPSEIQQSDVNEVACSVEIDNCDASIEIFTLEIRLFSDSNGTCEQYLKIMDADNITISYWNCSNNTVNIDNVYSPMRNYLIAYFKKDNNNEGGRFWIGFKPTESSNITVSCPPVYPTLCESNSTTTSITTTPTTTSTVTASSTSTSTTSSAPTTSIMTTSMNSTASTTSSIIILTSQTYNEDSNYDWMPIVIGVFVGIVFIVLTIILLWYCRCFRLCQRKQHQKNVEGNDQNEHLDNESFPTSEVICEADNQIAAVPIIAAHVKSNTIYKSKSPRPAYNKREEHALNTRKKKEKYHKNGITNGVTENVVNMGEKKTKSSKSSTRVPNNHLTSIVNMSRIEKRNETHVELDNLVAKGHVTKLGHSNSVSKANSPSEQNPFKAKYTASPRQTTTELFPNRDGKVSDVIRNKPVSALRSSRKKKRKSHIGNPKLPSGEHRSYPRPFHDSYSSDSTETDGNRKDEDIVDLKNEKFHHHIGKDVGLVKKKIKLRHIKKRRNKIRPKISSVCPQRPIHRQSKPFTFFDRDIKVLLGMIANYDRNVAMVSTNPRLVRSKPVSDLSRTEKPRKMSRKRKGQAHHEMLLRDKESDVISNEEISGTDDTAGKFVSRHRSIKTTDNRSGRKTRVERLKTTLEAVLNSSQLNLKSKKIK